MTRANLITLAAMFALALAGCDQPQAGEPVIRTDISGEKGKEIARADTKAEPAPEPAPAVSTTALPAQAAPFDANGIKSSVRPVQ